MTDLTAPDPRARLAFATAVVVVAVAIPEIPVLLALGLVLTVAAVVGPDLAATRWLGFLRPFVVLVPILFAVNLFFYVSGEVLWAVSLGPVPVAVTMGGLEASALIALRLVVVAGAAAWFAMATEPEAFELALAELGIPWRAAFVLSLTLRLVPELSARFRAIEDAQRARGLVVQGGPFRRARARLPVFIPFLASAIQYGYDLGEALAVRNFDRASRRTHLLRLEHRPVDYALYVAAAAVIAVFFSLFG